MNTLKINLHHKTIKNGLLYGYCINCYEKLKEPRIDLPIYCDNCDYKNEYPYFMNEEERLNKVRILKIKNILKNNKCKFHDICALWQNNKCTSISKCEFEK